MKKELKTENNNNSNKRTRVESGLDAFDDSPESKRVNSSEVEKTAPDSSELNRVNSSDSDDVRKDVYLDSPEAKQIREDILDILDEPDALNECPPEIQDLDSVMKSFEEEILHHSPLHDDSQTVLDLNPSESGESQTDLGYLLEASDDELGLPPTISPVNDHNVNAESDVMPEEAEFVNMARFEDDMPNYDTFDFGMEHDLREGDNDGGNSNGDFVTVGGLFDYPEPSDFSEFSWRQESLPAL
ncbi:hypothetical protein P3S68_005907 [Capsicum galapagoense]